MKIKTIHITNFGKLSNVDYDFSNKFSLCEGNGYGKSTIVAFISAMLYGLPGVRANAKDFSERIHYLPFNGGAYGGNIVLEYGGDTYRIERLFDGKKPADDKLTVYKNGTEDNSLGTVPGETMFGLNKDSFFRLIIIDSGDIDIKTNDDINQKLNNFGENVSEEFDIKKVLDSLSKKKKTFSDIVKTQKTELKAIKENQEELKAEKDLRDKLLENFAESKKEYAKAQNDYEEASGLNVTLEKWKHYESLLSDIEKEKKELSEAINKRQDYEKQKENNKTHRKKDILVPVFIVLGILIIFAGLIALYFKKKLWPVTVACGAVGIFLCVAMVIREKNLKKAASENKVDELGNTLTENVEKCKNRCEKLKTAAEKYKQENNLTKKPENIFDFETLRKNNDNVLSKYNEIYGKITKLDDKISDLEEKISSEQEIKDKIKDAEENEKLFSVVMTELSEADQSLKDKYISPIKNKFIDYSTILETVFGAKIQMDKNFAVKYEENGAMRDPAHLSSGNRAILALCYRLALLDNMFGEEQPFLVLDDPFVMLDGENMEKAKKLIDKLSESKQILYFTCHEARNL